MSEASPRAVRQVALHDLKRQAILEAARRVLARGGVERFTMRAIATEAGYVPGAVYFYFRGKDEIAAALAAQDLGQIARHLREAGRAGAGLNRTEALKSRAEALLGALAGEDNRLGLAGEALASDLSLAPEFERLVNGRLISLLTALDSEAASGDRGAQARTLSLAALILGLSGLQRSGRLKALGYTADEIVAAAIERLAPDA